MDKLEQTQMLASSYFKRIAQETGSTPEAVREGLKAEAKGDEAALLGSAAVKELRHQMLQASKRSHVQQVSEAGKREGWEQLL